jgi:hypothetical protein
VSRRRGGLRLRLDAIEAQVLSAVLTDIADAMDDDALAPDDPVRQRLFPAGYRDDDAAAAEFRGLTESTLRTERAERARACVAELAQPTAAGVDVPLDEAAATRWITALNDVRLALGTRLGITEDEPDDDPDAPDFQQRALYYWLTALQDSLVHALM